MKHFDDLGLRSPFFRKRFSQKKKVSRTSIVARVGAEEKQIESHAHASYGETKIEPFLGLQKTIT